MRARILGLLLLSVTGCRTSGNNSGAKSEVIASSAYAGHSYSVDGNNILVRGCPPSTSSADPVKVQDSETAAPALDCPVVKQMSVDSFKSQFKTAFESRYQPMTPFQNHVLEASIALVSGGSYKPATVGGVSQDEMDFAKRNLSRFFHSYMDIIDGILSPDTYVNSSDVAAAPVTGLALSDQTAILSVQMLIPFGSNVTSPLTYLGQWVQADRVQVQVSGANCRGVVPVMAYVGQNRQVGNLSPMGNGLFQSNFAGRRLTFQYLMVQLSQQQFQSVSCNLTVTAIRDDNTNNNNNDNTVSNACRQESAAVCPNGYVDECFVNRMGSHRCVPNGQTPNPPPVGGGCQLQLNQFTMAQPSWDFHGGTDVFTYSANNYCVGQVQIDWPGCLTASVTSISAFGPNGQEVGLQRMAVNNQGKGIYRVSSGSAQINQVTVQMSDPQRFRFLGCQVDALFK